ncbi:hypothetical protein [Thermoactinomyces sp. CICC 10523]|nr:hypothetical protein [Thermoactinomyces sp. CICC 10523]
MADFIKSREELIEVVKKLMNASIPRRKKKRFLICWKKQYLILKK